MQTVLSSESAMSCQVCTSKRMRAGNHDLVSSLLLAILLMAACAVIVMFSIWTTSTQVILKAPQQSIETKLTSAASSAVAFEFDIPTAEETVELKEPTLQQTVQQFDSVEVENIAAGTGVESSEWQRSTQEDGSDEVNVLGDDIVPRYQRWHLIFKAPNQQAYARQLDALGIHLGVFGGSVQGIDYACNLSAVTKQYRNDQPQNEKRLYFSWATSHSFASRPLARYELSLLIGAGITVASRQIVKFVPSDLEIQLAVMELEYARSKGVDLVNRIAKTVFETQSDGHDYRFVVIEQRYRDSR